MLHQCVQPHLRLCLRRLQELLTTEVFVREPSPLAITLLHRCSSPGLFSGLFGHGRCHGNVLIQLSGARRSGIEVARCRIAAMAAAPRSDRLLLFITSLVLAGLMLLDATSLDVALARARGGRRISASRPLVLDSGTPHEWPPRGMGAVSGVGLGGLVASGIAAPTRSAVPRAVGCDNPTGVAVRLGLEVAQPH